MSILPPPCPIATAKSGWTARWWTGATPRSTCCPHPALRFAAPSKACAPTRPTRAPPSSACRAHRAPVQQRQILRMNIPFTQEQVNGPRRPWCARTSSRLLPAPADLDRRQKAGCFPKGNTIHLMVAAWAWERLPGRRGMKRGIRVKISSFTRPVNITMTQARRSATTPTPSLANMEATDDGYDEAMLLDPSGFVSEGAGKTCSSSRAAWFTPRSVGWRPERHHPQHRAAHLQDLGLDVVQSASPVTRFTSAMRPSSLVPPPKSRLFANSTASRSVRAAATPSLKNSIGLFDIVQGRSPKYAHWPLAA